MARASAAAGKRRSKRKLTVADRVLLALAHVASGTKAAVPYEEIVIESWKRFPDRFSLRGHPEHPDSEDQNPALYGRLVPSGLVVALGDKTFRLTDDGLAKANALDAGLGGGTADIRQRKLDRVQELLLKSALNSDAYRKWEDGRVQELVDFDARTLFGITPATKADERVARVQAMRGAAHAAKEAGHSEGVPVAELIDHLSRCFPEIAGSGGCGSDGT